jgi:putative serine protease PepD
MSESDSRTHHGWRARHVAAPLVAAVLAAAAVLVWVERPNDAVASGAASSPAPTASGGSIALKSTGYDAQTIYRRDSPGVVDITVTERSAKPSTSLPWPFAPTPGVAQAEGSGFVLDRNGDIVTAAHVVAGASAISVTFGNGTTAKATLVGTDPSSDTAVIKVDVPSSQLTPLPLGDSATVTPGEGVVAIGSPFGYPDTITAGIVSAVGRDIQAPNGFTIPNAIQTDAAINHGNSGGPLIDGNGKVIGVNVQIATDGSGDNSGVGFAVPSNAVESVAADLVAGKPIRYPYLGIQVGDATAMSGARVGLVKASSPAAAAGLKTGDVISAVDGTKVADADQLTGLISEHKPGDRLRLTVRRNGSVLTLDVTLGTRPAATTT